MQDGSRTTLNILSCPVRRSTAAPQQPPPFGLSSDLDVSEADGNPKVTPQGAPPKMLSNTHRGQVFHFSREALDALKAEAAPSNATNPSPADPAYISTNDALSALLWRTVMAVQNPVESLGAAADPVSAFALAIDGRSRTNPPVHPRTQGCFLEYVGVELPIRGMLAGRLADVALGIRKSVARACREWTDDVVALVDGLEDVDRIVPKAFTDVPGYNCVQTSWVEFRIYDVSWGKALGEKVHAVRSPEVGVINGCQVTFPASVQGGLEVLVGVEENCLEKLMHDPLWNRFATAVV